MGELKRQYEQAEYFLTQLAGRFVEGDKQKIVLVPGNHDVSAYHFFKSLKRLEFDRRDSSAKRTIQQLFAPASRFRWSWDTLELFEIIATDEYERRLEPFCEFYARFYDGNRSFNLDPASQYDVFDFDEFGISVAALSSCYNNDLLNKSGEMHPDSIVHAARDLTDWRYHDRIRAAVWHHNTSGPPGRTDYMDADVLQFLIDSGFSLGFHGHQHRPQFFDERFTVGGESKITLLSAGTLCGGPAELPSGHPRSYNIVEIDPEALLGKLHLRRMHNDDFAAPVWGPGQLPDKLETFQDFTIQPPPQPRSEAAETIRDLGEAEKLYQEQDYGTAIEILLPIAAENPLARKLLTECYVALDDSESIVGLIDPPRSTAEIVYLADALWAKRDLDRLNNLINSEEVKESSDPAIAELRNRLAARLS
jgi:hypothetical protein